LIVKNEFQEIRVPFTLNISISFYYGARLLATSLGSLISLIGLVYSVNKVYNVLFKKFYRYPRSFKLRVGQEITDNTLFPISFVQTEITQSKHIFKDLKKFVAKEDSRNSMVEYFIDSESNTLDKEKIIATLNVLENNHYHEATSFSREIIQQLIINRIVMDQLSNKKEAPTRDIFNKIKNRWMDFVTVTSSSSQFVLNSENLERELSGDIQESFDETTLSTQLLQVRTELNMDLLGNAIVAHAFSFQNLNIDTIRIDVISYKKLKGNSLWILMRRLFLKDLKPFVFLNKREIGYGIEYTIDENTLHFSGKLTYDLKDNVIIVHVKNHRGRVLKEMWITGEPKETQNHQSFMEDVSETL